MHLIKCDSKEIAEAVAGRLAHYEAEYFFAGRSDLEIETDQENAEAMEDQFSGQVTISQLYIIKCKTKDIAEKVADRLFHYDSYFCYLGDSEKEFETDEDNADLILKQFGSLVTLIKSPNDE